MMEIMRYNFSISREVLLNPDSMGAYLLHSGKIALIALQPVLITLLIAALIGPIALVAGCSRRAAWHPSSAA
jgi:flagellar biosynthesis protein FlhB